MIKFIRKYFFEILIIFCVTIILGLSLYPQVTNGDSGELLSAGYTLGIAHPPGYPIYLILLKLFITIIPVTPAFVGNIMSALFTSLSMMLLYKNIESLFNLIKIPLENIFQKISLLFLILSFSITPVLYSQSIITEVYTLNLFFILLNNLLFIRYYKKKDTKSLCLFFFLYGISLTHHPTVILILPLYLFFIYKMNSIIKRDPSDWIKLFNKPVLFFVLGLLTFSYLIIRSQSSPPVNWGNPNNLTRFFVHIFRIEYKNQNLVPNRTIIYFFKQIYTYFVILFKQFNFSIFFALLGGIILFLRNRKLCYILLVSFLVLSGGFIILLNTKLNLHIIFTSKVFYIPSFVVCFLFIAVFFHYIVKKIKYLSVLSLIIMLITFIYSLKSQKQNYIAHDFSQNILKSINFNSALFTVEGDNPLFALAYLRHVEYKRPDIDYCNRYGKLFQSSADYFKTLTSIHSKELYFVSPERIDPQYNQFMKPYGPIFKLVFNSNRWYFLNWYYLRTGEHVFDYMDKGLVSIFYWRLAYFYKETLNDINKYQSYLKYCDKYGDDLIDIQQMLAKIYYANNEFEKAKIYYKNIVRIDPANISALFHVGMCNIKINKFYESLKYLNKAYEMNLQSIALYKALAFNYYKLGRVYEATIYIEEAIKKYPHDQSLKKILDHYQHDI